LSFYPNIGRYFSPSKWRHHGTFIDGGLSYNNPSILAMQETRRMAPELRRPDQFVSIGTGISKQKQVVGAEEPSSFIFGSNSLRQTFQHYWSENFEGDKKFASMRDTMAAALPEAAGGIDQWLRRFNLPLDRDPPDLADASAMDDLTDKAWTHFKSDPSLHDLALAILASCFYLELRCMPMYEQGRYICFGRILCRIPVTNPVFPALMQKLETKGAYFLVQKRKSRAAGSPAISFDYNGNFSRPFSLRVQDLKDELDVQVQFLGTRSYHVSASPIPLNTLIDLQKLPWNSLLSTRVGNAGRVKKRSPSEGQIKPGRRRCQREDSAMALA
jgi:hypothetical protein